MLLRREKRLQDKGGQELRRQEEEILQKEREGQGILQRRQQMLLQGEKDYDKSSTTTALMTKAEATTACEVATASLQTHYLNVVW